MLEGKEVDVSLGGYGNVFVDVSEKGIVELGLTAKIDLLAELQKLATKTNTPLDDMFLSTVAKLLGK